MIRINHPNVVDPVDYAEEEGEHYIIMPYVEGDTLAQHLTKNGGKLPCDEACRIAHEIAKGLAAIHPGIVHRDLKPENIIIGDDGRVYIVDFGICKNSTQKTITTGDGILGSLPWMSPQQLHNAVKVDHRSDLYSLGAMMYAMFTGAPPVQGKDFGEIAASILSYTPPSPRQLDPSIPLHIAQACMRLLEKDPNSRLQKAEDFIAVLNGTAPAIRAGRFCTGCGTPAQPGFRFCHNCGTALMAVENHSVRCLACGRPAGQEALCTTCGRPFGNSGHHLCFTTGSVAGITFRIPEGIFSVGRNELSPKDFHISRRHFFVACTNGSVCVQDAGSANKTFVGGKLAKLPTPLQPGQQICIAGNTATYNHN